MINYKKILPFRENVRVDEQFGFKPYSVIRPERSDKLRWERAYLSDDGERETRRSDSSKYLPNLGFSEFHAGLAESILRYWSMSGSIVVDPFAGRATRAVVATELGRTYYGYDISPTTVRRVRKHLDSLNINTTLYEADGTKLEHTADNFADIIFTCPPYYNIERYESTSNQLSDEPTYESFLDKMNTTTINCHRVLKDGAFMVWVVGDFRESGKFRNFHGDMINIFENNGFITHDIVVVENISPFAPLQLGKVASKRYTSKIHEYIIVARKSGEYVVPEYCSLDKLNSFELLENFFNI